MIFLNTNNIAFTSTENALLSLMNHLFNLQNTAELEFKLRNFFGSYRLFPISTLQYEAIFLSSRIKIFEKLNHSIPNEAVTSILSGIFSSYLVTPFFKLNIANHHNKLGNLSLRELFQEILQTQSKLNFIFYTPLIILLRGGLLGFLHLYGYTNTLRYIEQPHTFGGNVEANNDSKVREFIYSVDDSTDILYKLQAIQYFGSNQKH